MSSVQDLQTKTWIIESSQGTDLVRGDRLVFANGRILKEWAGAYTVKNDEITGQVDGLIFHIRPDSAGQLVCSFTSLNDGNTNQAAAQNRALRIGISPGTASINPGNPIPCMTITATGSFVAKDGDGTIQRPGPVPPPLPTPIPISVVPPRAGRS